MNPYTFGSFFLALGINFEGSKRSEQNLVHSLQDRRENELC